MTELHFYYSAMDAGKTTALLQLEHIYKKKQFETLILIPKISNKNGIVKSRIGIKAQGVAIDEKFNIFKYIKKKKKKLIIFIDEAQFLKKKQIFQLTQIVDILNMPVLTYGLRTDFKGKLFEGSKYLLSLADKLIEIKTICYCGKKATMNVKIDEKGNKICNGKQIDTKKNSYISTCRNHFYNYKN